MFKMMAKLILIAAILFLSLPIQSREMKNILVVTSFVRTEQWNVQILADFDGRFEKDYTITLFAINFINDKIRTRDSLKDFINLKGVKYDYVIVLGDPSTKIFSAYRQEIINPQIPVIYASENTVNISESDSHFVKIDFDYKRNIELAHSICHHSVLLYDVSDTVTPESSESVDFIRFKSKDYLEKELKKEKAIYDDLCVIFKSVVFPDFGPSFAASREALNFIRNILGEKTPIIVMRDNLVYDEHILGRLCYQSQ